MLFFLCQNLWHALIFVCVCAICDAMGYCNSTVCVCVCLYVEYACFDGWCLTRLSKLSRYLYLRLNCCFACHRGL